MASPAPSFKLPLGPPHPQPDSLLLRYLGRDSGSLFCFFGILQLNDLSPLSSTCRLLRSWLDKPNTIEKRMREIRPSRVHQLFGSWVCQHLIRLDLTAEAEGSEAEVNTEVLQQVLCLAPVELPLIATLSVVLSARLDADIVAVCMAQLASRLRILLLTVPDDAPEDALHPWMSALQYGSSLEEITLTCRFFNNASDALDLSSLPLLPKLSIVNVKNEWAWAPNSAQVAAVAASPSLTYLNLGTPSAADIAVWSGAKTGGAKPMQRLQLNGAVIDEDYWAQLSRMTDLHFVFPIFWKPMSAHAWTKLAKFHALESLAICPEDSTLDPLTKRSPLKIDDFLPTLIQCATIAWLQLGAGLDLTRDKLDLIVRHLPLLNRLVLLDLFLDDLSPLPSAPLKHLELLRVRSISGEAIQFRSALPTIKLLEFFKLTDPADAMLREKDAEPLNAALLDRHPNLHSKDFQQNLKRE